MTPRKYLSWSSMDLLERNEQGWIDHYIFDKPVRVNRGMAYGKAMADGLENGEATGDPLLDVVITRLPKFELMDKEFRAEIKDGKKRVPILMKIDTAKEDLSAFKEYKTSQEPWTQKKADDSGQVTFYATGIYLITGKIPHDIELVNALTEADEMGRLSATGDILRFPTRRTTAQIINMIVRMKKAWVRIEQITEEQLV